jgi:hypothetical protein
MRIDRTRLGILLPKTLHLMQFHRSSLDLSHRHASLSSVQNLCKLEIRKAHNGHISLRHPNDDTVFTPSITQNSHHSSSHLTLTISTTLS